VLEHADHLEQLEQHGPDEPTVRLSLTEYVFLRSSTWALAAGDPPTRVSLRHEPDRAPGQGHFERLPLEEVFLRSWSVTTHLQLAWSTSQEQESQRTPPRVIRPLWANRLPHDPSRTMPRVRHHISFM
jgi:hypothetical protein